MLSNYVQLVSSDLSSNTQTMVEILQMFVKDGFQGVPLMANAYDIDLQLLNSFLGVLLGEREKKRQGINFLLSRLNDITNENKKILLSIIEAYNGNMDEYLSLLEYSRLLQKETEEERKLKMGKKKRDKLVNFENLYAGDILRQFVWGFDFSQSHKYSTVSPEQFNIMKNTTLTQNSDSNRRIALENFWKIASGIEHASTPFPFYLPQLDSMSKYLDTDNYIKYWLNIQRTNKLLQILYNMVDNDFSFIIKINNLKIENQFGKV